jgi:hypothetical protein
MFRIYEGNYVLSLPKITSGRIGDAGQPERQIVGQPGLSVHPCVKPRACEHGKDLSEGGKKIQ